MSSMPLDISPAPDHVFHAGEVDHPAFHVEVAPPHGLHHLGDGDVVAEEPVRVDGDLVLLDEAADARHLRDARHAFQRELQVPVLEGAELRKVEVALLIDDGVLEAPAEARRVGAEDGVDVGGELVADGLEVFEDAAPRPVDVRPLIEDHVDEGASEDTRSPGPPGPCGAARSVDEMG